MEGNAYRTCRSLLFRCALLPPEIPLLGDGEFGTLALGQGDPSLVALTNNENVGDTARKSDTVRKRSLQKHIPGCKGPVQRILYVYDIKSSIVTLTVHNDTSTSPVASSRNHDNVSGCEFDKIGDLACLEVELDGVVHLDGRVGVADSASVMGDDEGDALGSEGELAHLAELVGSLFRLDAVDDKTAFDVVEDAEVFTRFFDAYNVYLKQFQQLQLRILAIHTHKACWESRVCADLVVDLDKTLLDDLSDLIAVEGIL